MLQERWPVACWAPAAILCRFRALSCTLAGTAGCVCIPRAGQLAAAGRSRRSSVSRDDCGRDRHHRGARERQHVICGRPLCHMLAATRSRRRGPALGSGNGCRGCRGAWSSIHFFQSACSGARHSMYSFHGDAANDVGPVVPTLLQLPAQQSGNVRACSSAVMGAGRHATGSGSSATSPQPTPTPICVILA